MLGGGYVASGPAGAGPAAEPGAGGLRLDRHRGRRRGPDALRGAAADRLRIGDRVWFRHTKAGELCERFDGLLLVEGDAVVDEVPTYRGEGHAFA